MDLIGLVGERVRLVPSEASIHLDNALRWFNDPRVSAFLDHYKGLTRREAELFFERMATSRETDLHWAIVTEEFGHVGFIALHQIQWPHRSASGGIVIGEPLAWGKGFATDAVRVRTRFAFEQLGLHRIEGHTMNPSMRRVYEKCGYRHEGVARQKRWRDGSWLDVELFSILESDDPHARASDRARSSL
jgi:[ribosomal protein S5]-alanine N-acetyltransferase